MTSRWKGFPADSASRPNELPTISLALAVEGGDDLLRESLERRFPGARLWVEAPGLLAWEDVESSAFNGEPLAFVRQFFWKARAMASSSIREWAYGLFEAAVRELPESQPWLLHVFPRYGGGSAGQRRCQLIQESFIDLLRRRRRQLARHLCPTLESFSPGHSLVQLVLTAPDRGWFSLQLAPGPYHWRSLVSPFPAGWIEGAVDKEAPSRAFAKLIEAERRLGTRIQPNQRCVDLGAAPGSWSYVAVHRGARVIAVDRAALRDDLMSHSSLEFIRGDAFSYRPTVPADWLLCDVIAAPARSVGLLLEWAAGRWMRRFVVTLKFKGKADGGALEELAREMVPRCADFRLVRLCANKNEVCAFGELAAEPGSG